MNNRRTLPTSIVLLAIVCGSLFCACTPEVRNYGSGGSGGSGSSSSTSSGGMPCMTDSECGASSECQSFACVNGACAVSFAAAGTIVAQQAIGDCQTNVCDGKGYVVSNPEPGDPADDNNPCTIDTCNGPTTMYGPVGAGMACDGTRFCNGVGYCVQCLMDGDCPGGVCFKEQCVPA
ncbi:MAG TPA: hypothetical protein PKA58_34170, partial [Polyangium sp.]|nr:hypothetical protein [Polyangium sp.]